MMHRRAVRAHNARKVAAKRIIGHHARKHGVKKVKGRRVHTTRVGVKHPHKGAHVHHHVAKGGHHKGHAPKH